MDLIKEFKEWNAVTGALREESSWYYELLSILKRHADLRLRDEFAAAALSAMTLRHDYSAGRCNVAMVERAFVIADLMLAEREKDNDGG